MLVCSVVGARPNYMKIAPVVLELKRRGIRQILVHTGQHYDANMSQVFFDQLGLPAPDVYLGVGPGSHAEQTGRIMTAFEGVCRQYRPSLVLAGGDVNSTLAVALVAAKENVPLGHVESGLRSFDRRMPEEINRVVTDHLSDLLFTTEASANENLRAEGIDSRKVHFTGNCMIDSLRAHLDGAVKLAPWGRFDLTPGAYALLTLHRPANVDDAETLLPLLKLVAEISEKCPIVFPIHPRTRVRLEACDVGAQKGLVLCEPLSYLDFLGLMAKARFVLTDSGGIQEETTALRVPCLTLRDNTERPVTITHGTNRLVGTNPETIRCNIDAVLRGDWPAGEVPPLWDGDAAMRIVDVVERVRVSGVRAGPGRRGGLRG